MLLHVRGVTVFDSPHRRPRERVLWGPKHLANVVNLPAHTEEDESADHG
jgi:hypothetical protein